MISANPNEKFHASAPVGLKCADCSMGADPCPRCYQVWWSRKNPNVMQLPVPPEQGQEPTEIAKVIEEMRAAADPSAGLQKVTFNQLMSWIGVLQSPLPAPGETAPFVLCRAIHPESKLNPLHQGAQCDLRRGHGEAHAAGGWDQWTTSSEAVETAPEPEKVLVGRRKRCTCEYSGRPCQKDGLGVGWACSRDMDAASAPSGSEPA